MMSASTSFGPQAFYGVLHGCFYCLEADGQHDDEQGRKTRKSEDPPGDVRTIGEVVQPGVHGEPGDGGCNKKGDEDQPDKIHRQEVDDTGDAGPENFSNAYLFCALDSAVSGKTQQTQTGDEDGQNGEIEEKLAELDF